MDAILKNALAAILLRIQVMSGESQPDLSSPDDRGAALELFARLKVHGMPMVPEEIEQWALTNGWARGALELRDMAAVVAYTPSPDSMLRSAFWQEDIVEVLGSMGSAKGTPLYQAYDKCKDCTLWSKEGAAAFGGCLMEVMKAQWAEPYWLTQCCISPDVRQLAGLVNSPPPLPI